MKKLAYVGEMFTRVLRITGAPDEQKDLIGRYLTVNGGYSKGLTDKFINQWTSTDFNRALRYSEEPGDIEVMVEYQEFLRKRNVNTEILLVIDHTSAYVLGESNDFDGDQVLFYFAGIGPNGHMWFLTIIDERVFDSISKPGSPKFKVGESVMYWDDMSALAWQTRHLPDEELMNNIKAAAAARGVTNVIVGRIYK